MKKKIVILGSTGSIGRNVLKIVDQQPHQWEVVGLCCHSNLKLLQEQAAKYKPKYIAIGHRNLIHSLKSSLNNNITIIDSNDYLSELASLDEIDLLINSLVGFVGVKPTLAAIENHNDVAIANKEALVSAGEHIVRKARQHKVNLIPIDSEHSAVYAILNMKQNIKIEKIIITASGGPFWKTNPDNFKDICVESALNHPVWDMGKKVTIDSATMANKGLEVIEAHYLYGLDYQRIEVLIHCQSIIHAMVETQDGSIYAHIAPPDMIYPIHFAMHYPEIEKSNFHSVDLTKIHNLTFENPDHTKFPLLKMAYQAGQSGGNYPAVFNTANEVAVEAFLNKNIPFLDIPKIVDKTLNTIEYIANPDIDDIYNSYELAVRMATNFIKESG